MKKKRINSKKKGNANELKLCKILSEALDDSFLRTASSGALVGGANRPNRELMARHIRKVHAADLYCETDNQDKNFRFCVEAKAYAKAPSLAQLIAPENQITEWMDRAIGDAEWAGCLPLLIFKYNGTPFFFAVPRDNGEILPDDITQYLQDDKLVIGLLSELLELTDKEWWWE